jgi:hypothetical protein
MQRGVVRGLRSKGNDVNRSNESLFYHEARLLILLHKFDKGISGLTKLAKLDFLLRYPTVLERLMARDGRSLSPEAAPTDAERLAVESLMIRYKYGPWDDLYYPLIGSLVGKGLAESERSGRTLKFRLTDQGLEVVRRLRSEPEWARLQARVGVLKSHYDKSGNSLRERIYTELPDIVDRPYRTTIGPGSP